MGGFLLPHARAYSSWDPLLQRSVGPHELEAPSVHLSRLAPSVATPLGKPLARIPACATPAAAPSAYVPASAGVSQPAAHLLPGSMAGSHGGGVEYDPRRESVETAGTCSTGGCSTGGCSTGYSRESGTCSSSAASTPADAAARSLEAQSLALAWRLQQEEEAALAEAISANSPMPGGGGFGGALRAAASGGGGEGGTERMETDEEEDASLRLAMRLQQEELEWHQIASRRAVSEAMGASPDGGLPFGDLVSDDDERLEDDEP